MRIGIVGAGNVGRTLAELLIRAGHDVTLSHDAPPEALHELVARLGRHACAATVDEAVRSADVAVLALPFARFRELSPAPFERKVVIDVTNYYPERDGQFAEIDDKRSTSSELVDRHLVDARLVKAFNNLPMSLLAEKARPRGAPDRIALPVSSDFVEAKRVVAQLVDDAGFDPVDLDGLVYGGRLHQQGGPLFLRPLTRAALLATIGLDSERPAAP